MSAPFRAKDFQTLPPATSPFRCAKSAPTGQAFAQRAAATTAVAQRSDPTGRPSHNYGFAK